MTRLTYYLDLVPFIKDQFVYKEGDTNLSKVYIIYEGEFKVTKKFKVAQESPENHSLTDCSVLQTSKRSVFKQPLFKQFCLRYLNVKQVVGLQEVLEMYERQPTDHTDKLSREHSVQCISQTGKMLVVYQDLFYDNFYNLNATAKNNVQAYNKD